MPTSSQKPNPLLLTVARLVEESPTQPAPPRVLPPPDKPRFMQSVRATKRGAPMLRALRPRRRG